MLQYIPYSGKKLIKTLERPILREMSKMSQKT
jgi:hypothetical protein